MRASFSLAAAVTASASVSLAFTGTLEAAPNGTAVSAKTGKLFAAERLHPSPGTVFLGDSSHSMAGNTPLALLLGSGKMMHPNGGPGNAPFMLEDCDSGLDPSELVVVGGGSEPLGGGPANSNGNGNGPNGVPMGGLAFGQNGAAGSGGNGIGGGGSFSGSDGGGGGTGPGNSPGNSGSNQNAGSAGSSNSNGQGGNGSGSGSGSNNLVNWNILPPTNVPGDDGAAHTEGGSGSSPLPLPAPVWMALAGLTLVIAFRRRLMP